MELSEAAEQLAQQYKVLNDANNSVTAAVSPSNIATVMGTGVAAGTASAAQIGAAISGTPVRESLINGQPEATRQALRSAIVSIGQQISVGSA